MQLKKKAAADAAAVATATAAAAADADAKKKADAAAVEEKAAAPAAAKKDASSDSKKRANDEPEKCELKAAPPSVVHTSDGASNTSVHAVSTISNDITNTSDDVSDGYQRRKMKKGERQKKRRKISRESINLLYKNMLIIGAEFDTKFLLELKQRIKNKDTATDFFIKNKYYNSKDVSAAIRAYHFGEVVKGIKVKNVCYSQLGNCNT